MDIGPSRRLSIRKYSNRRYYDTTRSCHVTLGDMYELIGKGCELAIVDSTSGEDITNVVLMQIMIEHETAKLAIFPPAILHQMIRTQQQFLGSVIEDFFRQLLQSHRAAQQQWAAFFRNTIGSTPFAPAHPAQIAQNWMDAFFAAARPGPTAESRAAPDERAEPAAAEASPASRDEELDRLREMMTALSRRLEELTAERASAQKT
ncbi:MAG: hypothetical protein CHACPFDD_03187 [Phycisphaerae bacterium]|nr:hypothetical protein [Phycisphaerae bacterium]